VLHGGVRRRRRLVEDQQERGPAHQGAGQADDLSLAPGEVDPRPGHPGGGAAAPWSGGGTLGREALHRADVVVGEDAVLGLDVRLGEEGAEAQRDQDGLG
jgi:hypothetical protein